MANRLLYIWRSEVFRSNICAEACALRYTMETGNPIVNLAIHIRDASGARVPVTVSTALLRDRDGRIVGGVEAFRDLNLVRTLLRDVEHLTGDERIITATNRNLAAMVAEGSFRQDLYYRINVIRLEMPPLRERTADVPPLAEAFLRRLSTLRGKVVDSISRTALRRLMDYDYPGNIRELENILEHGYVMCAGRRIEEHDLPDWMLALDEREASDHPATLVELEAGFIRDVLARNRWNRTDAARELGIHKTTLHRKIRRLAIDLPPEDGRTTRVRRSGPNGGHGDR